MVNKPCCNGEMNYTCCNTMMNNPGRSGKYVFPRPQLIKTVATYRLGLPRICAQNYFHQEIIAPEISFSLGMNFCEIVLPAQTEYLKYFWGEGYLGWIKGVGLALVVAVWRLHNIFMDSNSNFPVV